MTTETYIIDDKGRPCMPHDIREEKDYPFNWGPYLTLMDDALTGNPADIVPLYGAGMAQLKAPTVVGSIISVWAKVTTGEAGEKQPIACLIKTRDGRTLIDTVYAWLREG